MFFAEIQVLERYCQDEVTVLREACLRFRKNFLQIGNLDFFLKRMNIASACKKVFRKNFLQLDRIRIIPVGGCIDNRKQTRKSIIWLKLEEKKEVKRILHGMKCDERQLPEMPYVTVEGLCDETLTVYKFMGCYWHGHTCMPFGDTPTAYGDDTWAKRYGHTMFRLGN